MNNGHEVGLGDAGHRLAIYLANRPQLDAYPQLDELKALMPGELSHIVANTSNHWRKAFNVYAKLLDQLNWPGVQESGSWQQYRDHRLLQPGCGTALLFSQPDLTCAPSVAGHRVHIVAGKTYAARLPLPPLTWIDAYFAVNTKFRLIVSPYLDYRQLSNARLTQLVGLIQSVTEDLKGEHPCHPNLR